jgi:hypothetical protein
VAAPLAFGAHRRDSLMTALSTGMGTGAIHPDRLAYWQAWSDWHINALASGQGLRMQTLEAERPYVVPSALRNPPEGIDTCLKWWRRHSELEATIP